jgi:penicillin-binding protein 2
MAASSGLNSRTWFIRLLFIAMGLILIIRLLMLQVFDDKYKILANDQAIVRKVVYPARGIIIDRNEKNLVINNVAYDLGVTPNKIKNLDTALFCQVMNITKEQFERSMVRLTKRHGFHRQNILISSLSVEQNARLQENLYMFEGFELVERSERTYPQPIGAHIFGYLNEISASRLEDPRYATYRQGDYVGINGLENKYEEVLRGQRGVQYMVRDVMNRPRESYKNGALDTSAVGGKTIQLHLDADLQAYGEKLMQGKIGSVVAIEPETGGILAMISAPSYDPNLLTGSDFSKNFATLAKDYTTPLFNRAIQAQYPPGSTFKPITALIALDIGVATPSFGIGCGGGYGRCGRFIRCTHSNPGHSANLRAAMANSCNSYFMHLFRLSVDAPRWKGGVKEGVQRWHDYLSSFGLGHPLGIDITNEKGGNVPDSAYFNRIYNNHWNSCNMVVVGMGQGEIDLTPIQLANSMCLIANRGYYHIPHFVKSIGGNEKDPILAPYLKKNEVTHIPDSAFRAVIDGMEDVVLRGTGRLAKLDGISVCAKTGTVENYASIHGQRVKLDNHSVFVCFAPKENPKIALAVIVQNSGYGATWAGPIASLMMEKYLTDTVKRIAVQEKMFTSNTIKKYIHTLDSIQREKDKIRELLRTAYKRTQDSVKRKRDSMLVKRILEEYYNINTINPDKN